MEKIMENLTLDNAEKNLEISTMLAKNEGSGIKLETLEYTYETLKNSVAETERILEDNRKKREQDTEALEGMKKELIETNFFKKLK